MTRRMTWAALAGILVVASAGLRADDANVDADHKAMAGDWITKVGDHDDSWTFKGTDVKLVSPNRQYDMSIKIDSKAKPKTIDFKVVKGPEDSEGKSLLAIYKIDGDVFTICMSAMEGVRPTEFKMEENVTFVFELKRKK